MFHETNVSVKDARTGPVYLRFGTVDGRTAGGGYKLFAIEVELVDKALLTPIRSNLIMTAAEAIRLSDELRRLASDTNNETRRIV